MYTKEDQIQASNLNIFLKRGQFNLSGEECLAFSGVVNWLNNLQIKMEAELSKPKVEELKVKKEEPKPTE